MGYNLLSDFVIQTRSAEGEACLFGGGGGAKVLFAFGGVDFDSAVVPTTRNEVGLP